MSKKTYEAVANGFKARLKKQIENEDIDDAMIGTLRGEVFNCASMFADVAATDNARFNRERFLRACGF